jgi:hypothetical protein
VTASATAIAATNEPIRLDKQLFLHRACIPDAGRNEVVQLIIDRQ